MKNDKKRFLIDTMVKTYLRYVPSASVGLISTGTSNAVYDHSGNFAICPALEDVIVWHLKRGTAVARWHDQDNKAEVTLICRCPQGFNGTNNDLYAVGYADGSIRLWDFKSHECVMTLNGHKGSVTALCFESTGSKLISGSRDTDIIVWDLVAESGLFRLRGHKDQITWIGILNDADGKPEYVISSSKDTLVKVWDLITQHCVETVVGHRSEVWSACLIKNESVLITGTSDEDIKMFSIDKSVLGKKMKRIPSSGNHDDNSSMSELLAFHLTGNLSRSSKERVAGITIDPSGRYFVCQTADKTLEIYQIRSEDEIKKKMNRKKKRNQEKSGKQDAGIIQEGAAAPPMADEYASVRVYKASGRIRSFDFRPLQSNLKVNNESITLMISLVNNSLEVLNIPADHDEVSTLCSVDIPGHRSDIRTIALSYDDEILLTAGSQNIKLWNTESKQCIRTLPFDASTPVCSTFLPGNRHIIVGTKSGTLELYDGWSSTLLESIAAHNGTVWSIDVRPDKRGIVTGGSDKEVKFWDFSAIEDSEYSTSTRRLTLMHNRTLQMPDEVLCVKYSPNQELIAIALLDSTVKVFYNDTLKFFLSLYGHKLPVLSMDISSDGNVLVTGSADKNIKLWGLDFGDCHRSLFAHDDSVMQVKFVPQTHYFFSCSKDRTIKYWDGDKFEQIMKLTAHHGELWALCVSRWGNFVVSAGHDKSIRFWSKTDEQLFLEEEREKEIEETYEKEWLDTQNRDDDNENDEVKKMTSESVKDGERLCEAISIAEDTWAKQRAYENDKMNSSPPAPHPILMAYENISAERYVLNVAQKIKAINLDQAVWIMPFSQVVSLLQIIETWVSNGWNLTLCAKMINSIVKIHFNQISASKQNGLVPLKITVSQLKSKLQDSLNRHRDTMGYNMAGLNVMRRFWEQEHTAEFVDWQKEISAQVASVRTTDKKRK